MRIDHNHVNRLGLRNEDIVGCRVRTLIWLGAIAISLSLGCESSVPAPKPTVSDGSANPIDQTESPKDNAEKPPTASPTEQIVRVKIFRGVGTEPLVGTTSWSSGMTVFDALSGVSPVVAVESTGQGESLFVKSIAGQANLGSAGDNWIYRVNGNLGDRSSGVYEVEAGDEVVWSFGKYE